MSAISTDGMDKWLDDAYPDLDKRKANLIYELASIINDDPLSAPILVEELVDIMFDEQIDYIEDVIVNHFGIESHTLDTGNPVKFDMCKTEEVDV